MDLTEGSGTSAKLNQTPGKYPKEYIQVSEHGENLKSPKHFLGKADHSHENVYYGSRWKLIRSLTIRILSRNEIHWNVTVVYKQRERERESERNRQTDVSN
jgi:hypothetical protein